MIVEKFNIEEKKKRGDEVGIVVVEIMRNIEGKIKMMIMVIEKRKWGWEIKKNIGGNKDRIGKKKERGIIEIIEWIVIEMGNEDNKENEREEVEKKGKIRMMNEENMVEEDDIIRVDEGGEKRGGELEGRMNKIKRIGRKGKRVNVKEEIDELIGIMELEKKIDRKEIIEEVKI